MALSENGVTERTWLADFAEVHARLPFWLSPLLRPWMVFLPRWWPNSIGAWSYLQFVFIGAGVLEAPDDVRHYLVAHEYGHIHGNHTVLHFLYWFGTLLLILVYVGQLHHVPHLTAPD